MWRAQDLIPDRETRGLLFGDIRSAIGLLTRLPVTVDPDASTGRGAVAMWAFPLAGALVGMLGGGLAAGLMLLGVAPGLSAALGLAAMVLATGALHEDGLADTADGFGPPVTRTRRLEIMRDSRIGAFGTIAVALALLARWAGLSALGPMDLFLAAIAAATISRAALCWLSLLSPLARSEGMAARYGRPPRRAVLAALAIGTGFCILAAGLPGILVALVAVLAGLPVARSATRLIGGVTGDVLGAAQQVSEIAALAALTAFL